MEELNKTFCKLRHQRSNQLGKTTSDHTHDLFESNEQKMTKKSSAFLQLNVIIKYVSLSDHLCLRILYRRVADGLKRQSSYSLDPGSNLTIFYLSRRWLLDKITLWKSSHYTENYTSFPQPHEGNCEGKTSRKLFMVVLVRKYMTS